MFICSFIHLICLFVAVFTSLWQFRKLYKIMVLWDDFSKLRKSKSPVIPHNISHVHRKIHRYEGARQLAVLCAIIQSKLRSKF